jgi:hypothetical protein
LNSKKSKRVRFVQLYLDEMRSYAAIPGQILLSASELINALQARQKAGQRAALDKGANPAGFAAEI